MTKPINPDRLRHSLWSAVAHGDEAGLEAQCRQHRAAIVEHFQSWRKIPEDICRKPARMEEYVQTMAAIGRVFAQRLGDPSLLQSLTGDPASNPLVIWRQELDQAQKAMDEL